jgi:general stress protein YciG
MSDIHQSTRGNSRLTPLQGAILKRLPDPLRGVRPNSIRALVIRDLMRGEWGGNFVLTSKGQEALSAHQMIGKRPRGFGAMSNEKRKRLASDGGKAAHQKGVAHAFKKGDAFAIECGKRGGLAAQEKIRRQLKLLGLFTPQAKAS